MSGSHNKSIDVSGASFDVPGLTADEIQARVLHRDGLMLVIDKPAGLPVHRGPKGGANLEASFDGLRLRPAAAAGAGPPARQGYLRLPGAGTPPQGHRLARPVVQARQDRKDLLGRGRGRTCRGRRHHRHAARPAQRRARLVAEAGPGGSESRHQLEGAAAAATASPGWRWSRSPAAPINCACIRRRRAGRSSATISTATDHVLANRSCICIPARS